jgi:hypothetical protein
MTTSVAEIRSHYRAVPQWVLVALGLLAVAIVFLTGALANSDRPTHAVVWGSLALATYAAGLLCLIGAKQGAGLGLGLWRLGPWTLLWYGLTFGVASVTWSQPQSGTSAEISLSSALRALWLVAVAMTVWAFGYVLGSNAPTARIPTRAIRALGRRYGSDVRSLATPWILYAIGFAARIASAVTTGIFGYVGGSVASVSTTTGYEQILYLLALCSPVAVSAAALQVFREHVPGSKVTLAVLFLVELASDAASGGMQGYIVAVLALAIPFTAARRRLPKAALTAFVLIFLVVIIPFNQAYRNTVQGSPRLSAAQSVASAPRILGQTLTARAVGAALPDSMDLVLSRIRETDSPAIILQRTPGQVHFLSPADLIEAPIVGFVPRAIWHGKPLILAGYQFGQTYFGLPSDLYSWAGVTFVGDLYRYGGWPPLIVGMLILGALARTIDSIVDVHANPHSIVLVILLFPPLVKGEAGWAPIMSGIPGTLLLFWMIIHLTFRPKGPA